MVARKLRQIQHGTAICLGSQECAAKSAAVKKRSMPLRSEEMEVKDLRVWGHPTSVAFFAQAVNQNAKRIQSLVVLLDARQHDFSFVTFIMVRHGKLQATA